MKKQRGGLLSPFKVRTSNREAGGDQTPRAFQRKAVPWGSPGGRLALQKESEHLLVGHYF